MTIPMATQTQTRPRLSSGVVPYRLTVRQFEKTRRGWVERMRPTPRRIFLVHGELEAAEALRGRLHERTGADVRIPEPGEEFTLWT